MSNSPSALREDPTSQARRRLNGISSRYSKCHCQRNLRGEAMFDMKDEVSYTETLSSAAPGTGRKAVMRLRDVETIPNLMELGHDAAGQDRKGTAVPYD